MPTIKIKRGLDIPIDGAVASPEVVEKLDVSRAALLPQESVGAKVRVLVQEGDEVQVGTPLFCDRRDEAALFTSPAAGKVAAVNRGHRRAVLSIVVDVSGYDDAVPFEPVDPTSADAETVRSSLLGSGLWPALRRRPFDRVALASETPQAIVVMGHDSAPLAPDPRELVRGREGEITIGLQVLRKLTEGPIHLCVAEDADWSAVGTEGVQVQAFAGPHPSGTAGLAIHRLAPVGTGRVTWHASVQDVADIGRLFSTGERPTTRVVALTGPAAKAPKLVRTRPGVEMDRLCQGESTAREARFVCGSALWGRVANAATPEGFLSRYAQQVTILEDAVGRDLLGWALPVSGRFTHTNTVWDKFFRKRFKFDTDTNGSLRAIVPLGQYESVMPLDVLPTQLVKALASKDLEGAEKLGVLELAEEDVALLQFVDVSKVPITDWLREMLVTIEKEG